MSNVIVRARGLSVGYEGKVVLGGVDFDICQRDFIGVIGLNGCGKTTLMRVLLGLMKPMTGTLEYYRDGNSVQRLNMGYLPQFNNLDRKFPVSVLDVVLSGIRQSRRPFASYSNDQQTKALETLKTLEIDSLKHRHIGELSGGQFQRVLLARAIVSDPELLVLDEPNTYIDRHFQTQLYAMLSKINQRCAVVIVSHDIDAVVSMSRHVALVNRTVRICPSDELTDADLRHCLERV